MTSPADVAGNYSDIWSAHQPAFRFTSAEPGSAAFFAEIEAHRYGLEPHILEIVDFPRWRDKDVLEAGCGIGTDAIQFARSGAHYVGVDFAPDAVRLARRRFELEGRNGSFTLANILELPFE